jgi:hypothetical protein
VLSLEELRDCGLSRKEVARRARNGWLHRVHRGVYAVGHRNPPLEGRFLAAVKACGPEAVLSHRSAAALWGILEWEERHPEVTVPQGLTRAHEGIRVHRSRHLDGRDRTHYQGIPITTAARTVADLAAHLPSNGVRRLVRRALALRLASVRELLELVERLAPRPGTSKLRRVIAAGPSPTRTDLEDMVLDLILRGGLAHPDVNVPIIVNGRRIVPDFRWPEQRLIVEADSVQWHGSRLAREDDAERQAWLEAAGERVLRVTWHQAVSQADRTLARFRAAGAPDRSLTTPHPPAKCR